jgi:uncharacterized protein
VAWILALVLVLVGIAGTILPGVPGPVLVFAGIVVAAWADGFARIGLVTLVFLGLLTAATYAIDFVASALGVQRVGASRRAVVGAALGALVGLFFGLPGLILGPFLGAVAAELTVRGDLKAAGRAGLAAWLGFVLGAALKIALVFVMIGVAVLMLFVR